MRTILRGTETETLELGGVLPETARGLVPAPLAVRDGPLRVEVLLFAMHGLALRAMPWPRFDYREALWRIECERDGELGWYAIACDLDSAAIRVFGRRVVRYPTRTARFSGEWSIEAAGGTFTTRSAIDDRSEPPAPVAPRRMFVRDGELVFEIPWQEIPAPERHVARIEVLADSLSEPTFGHLVTWDSSGLVHRGRTHMCGRARRVD